MSGSSASTPFARSRPIARSTAVSSCEEAPGPRRLRAAARMSAVNISLETSSHAFEPSALGIEHLDQASDLPWIAALLEDEPHAVLANATVVNDAGGDRGAVGGHERRRGVEGEREKVAVARIALAQARAQRGQRSEFIAASQQKLGRVDRARAEKYRTRGNRVLCACGRVIFERDLIAVAVALDTNDLAERRDVGAALLGNREVVEIERVLGQHVASDVALAADRCIRSARRRTCCDARRRVRKNQLRYSGNRIWPRIRDARPPVSSTRPSAERRDGWTP